MFVNVTAIFEIHILTCCDWRKIDVIMVSSMDLNDKKELFCLIEIKNFSRNKGPGEYIGRYNYFYKLKASPLQNPFTGPINLESKLRLVEKFKKFIKSLPEESPQWREIRRLQRIYEDKRELKLICWCDPLPCHGEIIKSAILGDINPKDSKEKIV